MHEVSAKAVPVSSSARASGYRAIDVEFPGGHRYCVSFHVGFGFDRSDIALGVLGVGWQYAVLVQAMGAEVGRSDVLFTVWTFYALFLTFDVWKSVFGHSVVVRFLGYLTVGISAPHIHCLGFLCLES